MTVSAPCRICDDNTHPVTERILLQRTPSQDWVPTNQSIAYAVDGTAFSYYAICMSTKETIGGKPATDEQITAWADEAEAGFDTEALKKRGRGRPGRGAEPSQVVALRLTVEEIEALDARAEREGKTRSEVIREALATSAP